MFHYKATQSFHSDDPSFLSFVQGDLISKTGIAPQAGHSIGLNQRTKQTGVYANALVEMVGFPMLSQDSPPPAKPNRGQNSPDLSQRSVRHTMFAPESSSSLLGYNGPAPSAPNSSTRLAASFDHSRSGGELFDEPPVTAATAATSAVSTRATRPVSELHSSAKRADEVEEKSDPEKEKRSVFKRLSMSLSRRGSNLFEKKRDEFQKLFKKKKYQECLSVLNEILQLEESKTAEPGLYMSICICNALLGESDAAILALETSLRAGFSDFEDLQNNHQLDSISSHPDYLRIVCFYADRAQQLKEQQKAASPRRKKSSLRNGKQQQQQQQQPHEPQPQHSSPADQPAYPVIPTIDFDNTTNTQHQQQQQQQESLQQRKHQHQQQHQQQQLRFQHQQQQQHQQHYHDPPQQYSQQQQQQHHARSPVSQQRADERQVVDDVDAEATV